MQQESTQSEAIRVYCTNDQQVTHGIRVSRASCVASHFIDVAAEKSTSGVSARDPVCVALADRMKERCLFEAGVAGGIIPGQQSWRKINTRTGPKHRLGIDTRAGKMEERGAA